MKINQKFNVIFLLFTFLVKDSCDFKDKSLCGWTVYHKLKPHTKVKRQVVDDSVFQWIPIQANDEHTKVSISTKSSNKYLLS